MQEGFIDYQKVLNNEEHAIKSKVMGVKSQIQSNQLT